MTPLAKAKRVVVKIGSSLLTNAGAGLDRSAIADWVRQIAQLRARGVEVLVVSSGAIAEGMKRLGWTRRPRAVNELQADQVLSTCSIASSTKVSLSMPGFESRWSASTLSPSRRAWSSRLSIHT